MAVTMLRHAVCAMLLVLLAQLVCPPLSAECSVIVQFVSNSDRNIWLLRQFAQGQPHANFPSIYPLLSLFRRPRGLAAILFRVRAVRARFRSPFFGNP